MKPIVFYDFEKLNGDGDKLIVSKEKLEQLLLDVYNAGISDAHKNYSYPIYGSGNLRCADTITGGTITGDSLNSDNCSLDNREFKGLV